LAGRHNPAGLWRRHNFQIDAMISSKVRNAVAAGCFRASLPPGGRHPLRILVCKAKEFVQSYRIMAFEDPDYGNIMESF
jgi:hypothetical protein